jgi:hydrogenase assembly chaperone HypC/HupF
MCLAIPGQIKSIKGRTAKVKYTDSSRKALVGGANIKVGDWVMVEMGIISKIISAKEAKLMLAAWKEAEGGQ